MTRTNPRIYVADIAAYNAGEIHHGAWIDANQAAGAIREQIAAMLHGNKEWAIHSYDNFLGLKLDELESIEHVAILAQLVEEHGEAFAIWYASDPDSKKEMDAGELASEFVGAYQGVWADMADYAEEIYGKEVRQPFRDYIDWESIGRDINIGGDVWTGYAFDGRTYVYRNG